MPEVNMDVATVSWELPSRESGEERPDIEVLDAIESPLVELQVDVVQPRTLTQG
jgi:hypothetical protein